MTELAYGEGEIVIVNTKGRLGQWGMHRFARIVEVLPDNRYRVEVVDSDALPAEKGLMIRAEADLGSLE